MGVRDQHQVDRGGVARDRRQAASARRRPHRKLAKQGSVSTRVWRAGQHHRGVARRRCTASGPRRAARTGLPARARGRRHQAGGRPCAGTAATAPAARPERSRSPARPRQVGVLELLESLEHLARVLGRRAGALIRGGRIERSAAGALRAPGRRAAGGLRRRPAWLPARAQLLHQPVGAVDLGQRLEDGGAVHGHRAVLASRRSRSRRPASGCCRRRPGRPPRRPC